MENRELDEKLKQDDSESDQSEKSKVTSSSPTSLGGRRESSSSRTTDVKETKKEEKVVIEESKNDDIEEINYKEMLNRLVAVFTSIILNGFSSQTCNNEWNLYFSYFLLYLLFDREKYLISTNYLHIWIPYHNLTCHK